ncbi:MAG: class II glutamine amidotransferase [Bdellovibrionales bacterium]|nr:class II glutamine amidotransferase [Bdellovibrionales bacterium]
MCRIFGFRSVLFSKVHSSLVSAENALMGQSRRHPDGWGLVYYIADTPHVVKSTVTAESDDLFRHVSGIVTSQTVLAHIRKATHGKLTILNTHPFQYGRWTFAHNGNIKHFDAVKKQLMNEVAKENQPYCLGETDSEVIFHILLTSINKLVEIHQPNPDMKLVMKGISNAVTRICEIVGELSIKETGIPSESYLTFVISNGPIMIAMNGGMKLFYSTHKKKCPERETCSSFAPWCEAVAQGDMSVNHLIFSSEPLQGENIWKDLEPGEIVGVDARMKLHSEIVSLPFVKEVVPI